MKQRNSWVIRKQRGSNRIYMILEEKFYKTFWEKNTLRDEPLGVKHLNGFLSSDEPSSGIFWRFSAASALLFSISSFSLLFSSWEKIASMSHLLQVPWAQERQSEATDLTLGCISSHLLGRSEESTPEHWSPLPGFAFWTGIFRQCDLSLTTCLSFLIYKTELQRSPNIMTTNLEKCVWNV